MISEQQQYGIQYVLPLPQLMAKSRGCKERKKKGREIALTSESVEQI